jgi:hypothetical protein
MAVRKAITLRLEAKDYERLEAEAKRLGMRPGTLAQVYIRTGLAGHAETDVEKKRLLGLEALDRLAKLTADLPPIDAVEIARRSREELEQRSLQ